MTTLQRRDVLKIAGLGAGVTALGVAFPGGSASTKDWISTSAKPVPYTRRLYVQQPVTPTTMTDEYGDYNLYEITERAIDAQLLDSGAPKTPLLGYSAGGAAATVPGPLLKIDQNTRVRVRVTNALPAVHPTFGHALATSVHLHGSASLPQYDGYADDGTLTGTSWEKDALP